MQTIAEYKNVENIMRLFNEEFKKTRQLIQEGETHLDNLAEGFLEADRVIRKIPTADVVEVVFCKDCKNYEYMSSNNQYFCNKFGGCVTENDYCSRCERRCEE